MTGPHEFTSPEVLERELHRLAGLLQGIALDGRIRPADVDGLRKWCAAREQAAGTSAFREIVAKVRAATDDGVLDEQERDDLLWMCERARSPNPYWTVARTDMERLLGVLAGIGADHRVNETELALLRTLMAASSHLAGTWPYDEIDSVLKGVLADRRIDDDEHRFLVAFTRSFLDAVPEAAAGPSIDEEFVRRGACAVKPRIEFAGRRFCVTGTSPAATRVEIERTVSRLGGALVPDVAVDLDYLVVDAGRNVSWAFSCHGRKVEEALLLRREGVPLTIVHADDVRAAARA